MTLPVFPKRKADAISNGVFLVFLGILFYTGYWWPGILFALGMTFAIRQYLTGRRINFFIMVILIGLLALLTVAGHVFSLLFPFLFIAAGIFLISKECLNFKAFVYPSPDNDKPKDKE